MKLLKMFGLAALAAVMAMAFVGVSSAMAEDPTALCYVDPGEGLHEVCPEDELVEHVHVTTLPGVKGKLLTNVFNVECDVLFLGEVITPGLLSEGGEEKLEIEGNFTYANCGGCTVTEISESSLIEVLKIMHDPPFVDNEEAIVTGEGEVRVQCGGFINCTYNGEGIVGQARGPLLSAELNGEVWVHEQELNRVAGLFCPNQPKLDLLVTPLELIYITE